MPDLEKLLSTHPNRPEQTDESWDKLLWTPVPFQAMEVLASEDGDDNKLTFSFASEETVKRWYGTLMLSCKRGAMEDERVRDNAVPFCWEHIAPYDLGMVRKVWLSGRVAYTTVEFNGRMDSQEIKTEMKNGMRPNVSPLAIPLSMDDIEITEVEGSWDIHVAYLKWGPYEISSVSMPANSKVGIGAGKLHASALSMDSKVGAMIETAQRRIWQMTTVNTIKDIPSPEGGQQLNAGGAPNYNAPEGFEWVPDGVKMGANGPEVNGWKLVSKQGTPAPSSANSPAPQTPVSQSQETPVVANQSQLTVSMTPELEKYLREQSEQLKAATERSEILGLALASGHPEIAQEYLKGENTPEKIREKLATIAFNPHMMQGKPTPGQEQRFSIARLARAKLDQQNADYQREAQFELETVSILARQSQLGGSVVPFDVYARGGPILNGNALNGKSIYGVQNRWERPGTYLDEKGEPLTVVTAGTSGAANAIVTAIDLDRTVDFLVEDSDILMKCDVAMGLVGNVQIPIELTGATIGFTAENTVQAESVPTYGNVQITPHQMSANVNISKQAIIQTSGWIERQIRMLLARQFRSQINNYLLIGTGLNNQPSGLQTTTNLPTTSGGTLATLNWSDVVDHEEIVDNAWIPEMGRCWVMSNASYAQHLKTEKATNTGIFLLDKNMPLMSYDAIKSSFLLDSGSITPNTPATSTVTAKGRVIFGNFLDQFVGFWDGFEIVVEGITSPAEVKITIIVWWDTVTKRLASFNRRVYT